MLSDMLTLERNINSYENITFNQELFRKGIHLLSLSIPIIYSFTSKEFALIVLLPITILTIIIDLMSRKQNFVHKIFLDIFGKMLRPDEYADKFLLNGASWVFISACITIYVFPKIIAITAFSILIISDLSAALFGKKFGKHYFYGKTIEGSLAFLVSACLVVMFIGFLVKAPNVYFIFGIIGALVGMLSEAFSKFLRVDDNIAIPISIGLTLWAGHLISMSLYDYSFVNLL